MEITLYGPDNEVKATYTRLFVPWKLLKVAVRLAKELDPQNLTEADTDALAGLVVETFGNQFSIQDLDEGADITEMVTVLQQIVSKARGGVPPVNPPSPGS